MSSPLRLLAAAALLALACLPASAQTGGLAVEVRDAESHDPLPGATVTLSSDQGLVAPTALVTDQAGQARFPVLRAGRGYAVRVSMPGYASQRMSDLRISSNETESVVFRISAQIQETVTATAERMLVDVERAGTSNRFTDEFVQELPVPGRFYQNTLTLAPGVNDADGDGNPNVHGSRTRDFRATVGGVSNVDPLTGQWLSFVNPDSIEVMDIVTAGAGVEFGRAQGGFARIVQKQGTNRFEGVLGFIYRSSRLDGAGANNLPEALTPEFDWLQPSIQLSGPLIKDRLWYRLSHEYIQGEEPVDALGTLVATSRNQTIIADQITWQVSPRNKLAFQYQYDPMTLESQGVSSTVPDESSRTFERGGPTYSLTWTAPQSPRLLTEAVVAYQDTFQNILPTTQGARNDCAIFPYWRGWGQFNEAYCLESTQGFTSGSYYEDSRDKRQRLTVSGKATWYKGRLWGANHRFQFGFIAENERYYREIQRNPQIIDIDPYWAPAPPGAMCKDCPIPKAHVTVRVSVPGGSAANATGANWALFAEDQIKPRDNLVITAGLRLDREEIDSEGRSPFDPVAELAHYNELVDSGLPFTTAFRRAFTGFSDIDTFRDGLAEILAIDPDLLSLGPGTVQSAFWDKKQHAEDIAIRNTNISPRLSVAWDPWGQARSKLAVSAGRYYDKIFLAVPLVELEPQWTNLVFDANEIASPVRVQDLLGSFNPTISAQQVDRSLGTPYQDEFSIGFEQAVATETTLRLTYLNRRYRDQLQDFDINHAPGDKGACVSAQSLGHAVVLASDGTGAQLKDLYTGEVYTDTDPGPGDGRIDDCTGNVITELVDHNNLPILLRPVPDGLADLYVQNPGWGEILLVGNFNNTDYQAYVVELIRRMYRGWEMQASYTWSEATGDAEDFAQLLGNERNLLEDERGWLSYDQRHVAQVSMASILPGGFRFGSRVRYESGLPYSIQQSRLTIFSSPPEFKTLARDRDVRFRWRYPTGQRNDQRNPSFWTIDLKLTKEFRFSQRHTLQVSAEVFNLLNDDTIQLERRLDGASTGVRRFGRRWQLGLRLGF